MTADKILKIAQAEIGVKETPSGSNKVKYNTWYYGREVSGSAYPWCMVFVQWVFDRAGAADLLPARTASCGALMRAAKSAGCWVTGDYQPGDVVIYDFPGGAATDHTGIVEGVSSTSVTAIEGNTSGSNASNGGQVCRMTRKLSLVVGAVRPKYEQEDEEMLSYEQWKEYMKQYREELRDNDSGAWSEEAREFVTANGIFQGSGTLPDGSPNYMWEDLLTREQEAAIDKRMYDLIMAEVKKLTGLA